MQSIRRVAITEKARSSRLLDMVPSLIQSAVIAVVGYLLTGQVEQGLKDRQATLTGAKIVNELVLELEKTGTDTRAGFDVLRRIATFGVDAIDPLIMLGLSNKMQPNQVAEGLALVAISHRSEVCRALRNLSRLKANFPDRPNPLRHLMKFGDELNCAYVWP